MIDYCALKKLNCIRWAGSTQPPVPLPAAAAAAAAAAAESSASSVGEAPAVDLLVADGDEGRDLSHRLANDAPVVLHQHKVVSQVRSEEGVFLGPTEEDDGLCRCQVCGCLERQASKQASKQSDSINDHFPWSSSTCSPSSDSTRTHLGREGERDVREGGARGDKHVRVHHVVQRRARIEVVQVRGLPPIQVVWVLWLDGRRGTGDEVEKGRLLSALHLFTLIRSFSVNTWARKGKGGSSSWRSSPSVMK